VRGNDLLRYLRSVCRDFDEGRPLRLMRDVVAPIAVPAAVVLAVGAGSCQEEEDGCPEVAYYGPPPCATDEDCIAEHGAGWVCDQENAFGEGDCAVDWAVCRQAEPDPCPEVAYYGPAPCAGDEDCVAQNGAGWVCDQENTFGEGECAVSWPVCRQADPDRCPEVAYYGPPPCSSDEDCIAEHGAGWVCDEDNAFGEGDCAVNWAVCRQAEPDPCAEVAYYGPPPCTSDEECVAANGAGWVCDEENTFGPDECAVSWPVCRQAEPDPCPEVAYYGPPPCSSDEECVAANGEGWVCDEENTFGAGDCAVSWPVCREAEPSPCPEVAWYGPPPCSSDEDCAAGWVCDEENTFGEGDCAVAWPVCREA
jgi:hypothetical protein